MNGLLQRLAGQALGAKAANLPTRIRAAASVHAHAPVGTHAAGAEQRPSLLPPAASEPDSFGAPYAAGLSAQPHEHPATTPPRAAYAAAHVWHADGQQSAAPAPPSAHDLAAAADTLLAVPAAAAPLPERLLGETAPAALDASTIMPIHLPAAAAAAPRSSVEQEPTEVHVHIGRIEVTAVHEAAAPPTQRRAQRPSRPLSDYLARRSGK